MLYFNALLSLPYYGSLIIYNQEMGDIVSYFQDAPPHFYFSFVLMLILGCTSELVANFVVMKISPFYKATVSNLKDVIILFASVEYFGDFKLSTENVIGLLFVFVASLIYSLPIHKNKEEQGYTAIDEKSSSMAEIEDEAFMKKLEDEINGGE